MIGNCVEFLEEANFLLIFSSGMRDLIIVGNLKAFSNV